MGICVVTPLVLLRLSPSNDLLLAKPRRDMPRQHRKPRRLFIDVTGKAAIDVTGFPQVQGFSEGLAAVLVAKKGWGYIDKQGNFAIAPQFDGALSFHEGLAGVQIGAKWGFIDRGGQVVIEPQYERVNYFSEGMAVVVGSSSASVETPALTAANKAHSRIVKDNRITLTIPSGNRPGVEKPVAPSQQLVIDKQGKLVLSLNPSEVQVDVLDDAKFSEGLLVAYDCERKKTGFLNATGKFVIQSSYDEAAPFSEGLARVAVDEKGRQRLGFINTHGEFVIAAKFNTDFDFKNSNDFSEGLAGLTENLQPTVIDPEKYAFIDRTGAVILRTKYFFAGRFRGGGGRGVRL